MTEKNLPLLLEPFIADYLWGGSKLITEWGKDQRKTKIAETWELSAFPNKESIVCSGPLIGKNLSSILKSDPAIFGNRIKDYSEFPLLIKIINAEQNLSIQVHPSDSYAKRYEGQLGKSEIWYIVEASEGAEIFLGFNKEVSKEEIVDRIKNSTLLDVLNRLPVKRGDVITVKPGTVHALLKGLLVIEIQENSNLTYRIFDYGRKDSFGKERELHIEKALEVINFEKYDNSKINSSVIIQDDSRNSLRVLDENEYFYAIEIIMTESMRVYCRDSFISLTLVEGEGKFSSGETIKKGNTFLLSADTEYNIRNIREEINFKAIAVTLGKNMEEKINVLFRN
ncbi:MAG: type I phosphomannose isomerase catalytic subunit [Clostridia bacterium]|jgi:mannose-6-phosphate isomerase